jgi:hypothetical protein
MVTMRVELRDSLENLFTDSKPGRRPVHSWRVDVGRGGLAAVHVLVTDLIPGASVRLGLLADGASLGPAQWFQLIDVPVEENTGMSGFTESTCWEDGSKAGANPYVIRKAPFRTYDAMKPISSRIRAMADTLAFRLHLPISPHARAGTYAFRITLQMGTEKVECRWEIHVFNVVIPPVRADSLAYTNWFLYDLIAKRQGLRQWSPEFWAMLRKYIRLMVHGRQNTAWIPMSDIFEQRKGRPPVFQRERMERLIRLFQEEGIQYIEGGHLALADPAVPQWKAERLSLGMERKTYATSPEGYQFLLDVCRPVYEVIQRFGLQDRWIQHLSDEPNALLATDYRLLAGWVRKLMPGIKIGDALMDASFAGAVDIWCPTIKTYQTNRRVLERQRKAGDLLWVYTCCVPGGPWLNRLLDQELLRPVLMGWGLVRFNLQGFLHWGLNVYHERHAGLPFHQSVIKEGNLSFPAGDTHIIYPGPKGPWSSLRFEAHREGFEDAELLRQLKARSPRQAEKLIRSVFRDFKSYTRDLPAFRATRRRLLSSLS